MAKKPIATVEEYISLSSADAKVHLRKLRRIIQKAVPGAQEAISYNIPAFRFHGRLVWFAAWAHHYSLYFRPIVIAAFQKELKSYKMSKSAINIPLDTQPPVGLITKMVKSAAKKNLQAAELKTKQHIKKSKGTLNLCSRGHKFNRSSDCPVCPMCWAGYYRKRMQRDFPDDLATPALRALRDAKITKLSQLSKYTESEILKLHGLGPSALSKLRSALKAKGLAFYKKI